MGIDAWLDPAFMQALQRFIGSPEELEFERRGFGDSNYTLHGRVVACNPAAARISILRTRTHAGEVHDMNLRFFLRATTTAGQTFVNHTAHAHEVEFRESQHARERALEWALATPNFQIDPKLIRSHFAGRVGDLFVFEDRDAPSRRVSLLAKSTGSILQFMSAQDVFVPLDDALWFAVQAHVLWPAGIAFDRQERADAWSVEWPPIFQQLQGIPPKALQHYLKRISSGWEDFRDSGDLEPGGVQRLLAQGLLVREPQASSPEAVLDRVSISGLRRLIQDSGSSFKGRLRTALTGHLIEIMTPALEQAAMKLVRPEMLLLRAPAGLSAPAFTTAVSEYRDQLFTQRQWLRGTDRIMREDDLRKLVETT